MFGNSWKIHTSMNREIHYTHKLLDINEFRNIQEWTFEFLDKVTYFPLRIPIQRKSYVKARVCYEILRSLSFTILHFHILMPSRYLSDPERRWSLWGLNPSTLTRLTWKERKNVWSLGKWVKKTHLPGHNRILENTKAIYALELRMFPGRMKYNSP